MKEKMSNKFGKAKKVIMSLALCAAMVGSMATTAFAAQNGNGGVDFGPDQTPTAAITKVVETAQGETIPAMTFKFTAEKVSIDGVAATDADKLTMPNITINDIVFDGTETATDTDTTKDMFPKEGNNFLTSFDLTTAGLHPGIYEYLISETVGTVNLIAGVESMHYETRTYSLKVFVREKADGTLYISGVSSTIITATPGDPGDGDKVDPTPGSTTVVPGDTVNYSGMTFHNAYSKKTNPPVDPNPNDPDTYGLRIGKTVTGATAATTEFDFTFNVTKPATSAHTDTEYKYHVVLSDSTLGAEKTGTYNTPITEKLTHGKSIIVKQAYVGSLIEVTETGVPNYIPSATIKLNNVDKTPVNAAVGRDLSIGAGHALGENANQIEYTNRFQDMTPTGIVMNNLPFFCMILIAVMGLITYVVIKGKKRKSFNG